MSFGIYNQYLHDVLYDSPFEDLMIDSEKIELGKKISESTKIIINPIIFNFGDLSSLQLRNLLFSGCSPLNLIFSNPQMLYSSMLTKTKVPKQLIKVWYEKILMEW